MAHCRRFLSLSPIWLMRLSPIWPLLSPSWPLLSSFRLLPIRLVAELTCILPDHEWWLVLSWHYTSHYQGCFCHVPPIKSNFSQTSHKHKNKDQHVSTILADRRRIDMFWTVAANGASCVCSGGYTLATEAPVNLPRNHPHHLSYDNAVYAGSDISIARHPPSLYEGFMTSWLEKGHSSPQNEMGWFHQDRPQFCWPRYHQCCPDGLWPADRPQWRAFVSGLPTLKPEQRSWMKNEDEFIRYTYKIYNSGYNTEMINKQCNAGDNLETPGGLWVIFLTSVQIGVMLTEK